MDDLVVDKANLIPTVWRLLDENCRLATVICLDQGKLFLLTYYFHKQLELVALRVRIRKNEELPSISGVHFPAALIENELKELFGIKITNIALNFEGRMLLTDESPEKPLLRR